MPENPVQIIPAGPEQEAAVYSLICQLQHGPVDREAFSRIYRQNLADERIHYLLAQQRGESLGFASLHIQALLHHVSPVGEMQELVVARNSRGTGVGTRLLDHIRDLAKECGCSQLEICCNLQNLPGHGFYQGYGLTGTHLKYTLK